MSVDKEDIENILDRIEYNDHTLEESERLQIEIRKNLLSRFGEVLWGIAVSPDYKWSRYRDCTVTDLLTALGIEVEGMPTEKAVRPLPVYLCPSMEYFYRLDLERKREELRQETWAP